MKISVPAQQIIDVDLGAKHSSYSCPGGKNLQMRMEQHQKQDIAPPQTDGAAKAPCLIPLREKAPVIAERIINGSNLTGCLDASLTQKSIRNLRTDENTPAGVFSSGRERMVIQYRVLCPKKPPGQMKKIPPWMN